MDSTLVVKVKHGDTLRRFNAKVNENEELDLDMNGLRAKILGLFNFPLDADLTLTYVDEDGDMVTLVDDDDLRDVTKQRLKYLRIDVQLNNEKFVKSSSARSSGSTTPMRSPQVANLLPTINTGIAEALKSLPEPLHDSLSKLYLDLASKTMSVNPLFGELVECLTKMGLVFAQPTLRSQAGTESSPQTGTSGVALNVTRGVGAPTTAAPAPASASTAAPAPSPSSSPSPSPAPAATSPLSHVSATALNSAAVDLNLDPPCEASPCGFASLNFAPARSFTRPGNDRKETDQKNASHQRGNSLIFGASTNRSNLVKPRVNECPFSGMPVANVSNVPPVAAPINLLKRSNVRNDATSGIFHRGVQCDGCGVHPIIGPRYKSKVKEDYDLCSICFAEMGNETDYIKMDRPVSHRHPRHLKGFHDPNYWVGLPPVSNVIRSCGLKAARSKLDSRFILDVNVLDGTMVAPSTPFTKIWRMRNSGTLAWPKGVRLMWVGGDRFSHTDSVEIEVPVDGVPVDGEIDIAVDFTSPALPGRYISYWRLAFPSGFKFGQRVWVLIQVDASLKESLSDGFQGLNLNLPPDCNGSKYPETAGVIVEPVVDGGLLESSSVPVTEPLKPVVDEQPKEDQELNFPINDTLLVGHGVSASSPPQAPISVSYPIIDPGVPATALTEASSSVSYPIIDRGVPAKLAPPQASSSVSYPIIDLSEAAPSAPSEVYTSVPISAEEDSVNDEVEKSLLKELEEMGFKQVDLNKEILRMNEYNLEQCLDDLCGVEQWDPILEELQEMGFCDEEVNRKLLKKNNGSIKGVVMDLLTGEKA